MQRSLKTRGMNLMGLVKKSEVKSEPKDDTEKTMGIGH